MTDNRLARTPNANAAITVAALAMLLLTAGLLPSGAAAQTTYRWVDKSGQTVYSDQPPPADARQVSRKAGEDAAETPPLPYATRMAASNFPVRLYTTASCIDPCKQARDLLNGRGVPFAETMMNSQEELDALAKKLGGESAVPALFVGQQSFKGIEPAAWNNLLDLAGYPKSAPYGSKASGAFTR